ncbi:MAG: hypothetical protein JO228_11120 [Xanthobacteraceae bacterium]|nr:hypothetical protein [Xanthobacteraceae bacterium]
MALPEGIGVEVSDRQVVRLLSAPLDELVAEDRDVLRAGLGTARWITVDDTAARHARKDGVTTQLGDDRLTAFRTGIAKSREAFLSLLRVRPAWPPTPQLALPAPQSAQSVQGSGQKAHLWSEQEGCCGPQRR